MGRGRGVPPLQRPVALYIHFINSLKYHVHNSKSLPALYGDAFPRLYPIVENVWSTVNALACVLVFKGLALT